MKAADIEMGASYIARVSGRLVTVKLHNIYFGTPPTYDVENLSTRRRLSFHSARRFLRKVFPTTADLDAQAAAVRMPRVFKTPSVFGF